MISNTNLKEHDMDPEVLSEAKDFVSTAIEKASGGAAGVDTMVSEKV